ncbi:hypothetical protein [Salinibacter sp.]|nr:hypothetical protein [Salinibacter sp.]
MRRGHHGPGRRPHCRIDQYQARLHLLHFVEVPETGQLESSDNADNE